MPTAPALRRSRAVTLALFALALALRAWVALRLHPAPAWDGVLYERGAQSLARGLGYATFMFPQRSSDTVATAFYPVGYPAVLGLFYRALGPHLWVMHALGAVVSALTVPLVHRLALRFARPLPAALAALLLALNPGQILYASAAMTEPLVGLLLCASLSFALPATAPSPSRGALVAAALCLALATYVRPQSLLLAPLLPLVTAVAQGTSWRRALALACALTALTVLPVLPWTARNCARLDGCALLSNNGGSNLAIGAVPRADGRFFFLNASDGCRGVVGEVTRDRCWRAVALHAVRESPARWLALAWPKLEHTLRYEAYPVGYLRESGALLPALTQPFAGPVPWSEPHERSWRRALTACWRVLLALALLGLLPRTSSPAARALLFGTVVVVATQLGAHVLFFGGDRYHLPLVPLCALLAARALEAFAPASSSPEQGA